MSLLIAGVLGGLSLAGAVVMIPVFQTVARIYPYSYSNARIRSMRPDMISFEELQQLTTKSYSDIIYYLEKKNYPNLSTFLGVDFSFAAVDTALRSALVRDLTKLKRIVPDNSKKFVSVYLSRYDIQIIQSIVRSANAKINSADLLHLTEVFSEEFIAQKKFSLEDLYNELKGTVYEPFLAQHMSDLKKRKFKQFETALDSLLARRTLHNASTNYAKGFIKRTIDIKNISLVFKKEKPILPGGKIPLEAYNGKTSVEEIISLLKKHGYKVQAKNQEQVELQLQKALKNYGKELMKKEPLSEASIIGYLILKTINVRNISILLKLKYHNFPAERIKEVMV